MKLLLALNLLILTVKIQAEHHLNNIGNSCNETDVSAEDVRHKLSTGLFAEIHDSDEKWEMLCFSYKIGLVNENGMIKDNFAKKILNRAADKVVDICLDESRVEFKEDKIGLMNDYGEIKEKFIKGVLKRAADEVADICSRDTENLSTIDERNFNLMRCLQHNLPISLSML
ncbi:hypothetical protein MTP99_000192 [Tenebrio molitor]|nr:hypothetical protein MTP99_000192 [Tenebrio molitor]